VRSPRSTVTRRWFLRITALIIIATVTAAPSVWSQDAPSEPPTPTPTPAPTPIPAAEVPAQTGITKTNLDRIIARSNARESVTEIESALDDMDARLEALGEETSELLAAGAPRSVLEETGKKWLREDTVLAGWLETLQARSQGFDKDLEFIKETEQIWQLTLDSAADQDMPPAVRETIQDTLRAVRDTRDSVTTRRDAVLTLQTRVSSRKSSVSDGLAPIRDGMKQQSRSILAPNQPPIWRTPWNPPGDEALTDRFRSSRGDDFLAIKAYVSHRSDRVTQHLIVFLFSALTLAFLGRRAKQQATEDPSFQNMVLLLSRPIAAALLISTLIGDVIHPQAPAAARNLLSAVTLLALFRLLPPILPHHLRPGLLILVGLFFSESLLVLIPQEVLLYRIGLLALAIATAVALEWMVRRVGDPEAAAYPRWLRASMTACRISIGLMVVAALANIVGSVDLAEVLVQGVLISVYYGILLWTGAQVLSGAVAALLRTSFAQRFNMVQLHSSNIQNAADNAINFVAVVMWFSYALHGFGLWTEAVELIEKIASAEVTIFGATFQPSMIIPVLVAVWLTFKVSKFVNFVLADDVLPKLSLPRGLPNTILTVTHYLILTIGFLVIVSMLGLDLTKFTIIAGALSVGIGFGLQNVVNNFVSGLILLFERPIKEGDKVEVGSVSGVVKRIGTRASIIRTWQGAEVIVPNANLLSNELTNWTLYDMRRRADIPIGVAYGTDPETVMKVLLDLAHKHPEVIDDPAPAVQFNQFGDSSLDFELRVWTTGDFVQLSTDLRVELTRALKEHGIEIPYPQRDLHLRSVAGETAIEEIAGSVVEPASADAANTQPSPDAEGGAGPGILGGETDDDTDDER